VGFLRAERGDRLRGLGFAVAILLIQTACGGGEELTADAGAADADPDAPDADTVSDAGEEAAFVFTIELMESRSPGSAGMAYASVYNPWSTDGAWVEAMRVGDCVFNEASLGVCEPPCELPDVCHPDGTCAPPVTRRSAGTIEVTGLAPALTLTPQEPYDYYTAAFDPEPTDGQLFSSGDLIAAAAAGDSVPPFSVSTTGVADLITALPCELPLDADTDLALAWTPATGDAPIRFVLQSGNHGAQFSSIVCETADTGSLVVDASLVAAYLDDFHPLHRWTLTRSRDGIEILGDVRVELRARSSAGCQWY